MSKGREHTAYTSQNEPNTSGLFAENRSTQPISRQDMCKCQRPDAGIRSSIQRDIRIFAARVSKPKGDIASLKCSHL